MKHAVIVAHGPLGAAFIEAAKTIMGTDEGLFSLAVTDMSVQEIQSRLNSIVNDPREDVEGIIIMACLRGGSSWNVSAAVAKGLPHVRLVSGVNLGMLLTFLLKRETLSLDNLVDEMKKEAGKGITSLRT
jgi:mannose/fructose-specific phosphotransferase system component IIA